MLLTLDNSPASGHFLYSDEYCQAWSFIEEPGINPWTQLCMIQSLPSVLFNINIDSFWKIYFIYLNVYVFVEFLTGLNSFYKYTLCFWKCQLVSRNISNSQKPLVNAVNNFNSNSRILLFVLIDDKSNNAVLNQNWYPLWSQWIFSIVNLLNCSTLLFTD